MRWKVAFLTISDLVCGSGKDDAERALEFFTCRMKRKSQKTRGARYMIYRKRSKTSSC